MFEILRRVKDAVSKPSKLKWLPPAAVILIMLSIELSIELSLSGEQSLPAYTIFAAIVATAVVWRNSIHRRQQEDALIDALRQLFHEAPTSGIDDRGAIQSAKLRTMLDELHKSYQVMSRSFDDAVVERTIKLAEAVEEANSANRAKSTFLATMSHELRTPLNGIIGMGELLLSSPLSIDQQLYVRMAKESAEGMVSIINDLLDLSKIHAGFFTLHPEATDLESIVSQVFRSIGVRGSIKGLEVACEISPAPLPRVMVDPLRFRQVLINLVGNAIKFTSKGGVVVSVAIESNQDDAANSTCSLKISVRDTGKGISEKGKAKLFKPFMSGLEAPRENIEGTGLGLSIVRELVELMDGTVTCESQEGHGSVFTISIPSLPLVCGPHVTLPTPSPKPILLIHGDGMAARSVLNALVSYGYQIHVVKSVDAALKNMAHRSGISEAWQCAVVSHEHAIAHPEATARLAQLLSGRVITTVPSDRLPDMNTLLALGVQGVVSRPFVPSEILHSIERFAKNDQPTQPPTVVTRDSATDARATSLRVLVSDDTSVNRMVTKMLLEKCGHRVETVGNGVDTLGMVNSGDSFDLLLLDLELPDLDGLEVARRIRSLDGNAASIPIIALTAHDADSYRDLCVDAGMNDCISKPISLETLARVVEKTAMEADGTEELYRTVVVKKKRCDPVHTHGVDFDDMRQRYGDDDELVQAIIASFVAEAYELRARLAEAFASGSRKKVASVAHAIKSSASSVSARALWQCADQLEHASNFEYEANLEPYHTQLLRQWENTVDFLSRNSEATLQDSSEATTL